MHVFMRLAQKKLLLCKNAIQIMKNDAAQWIERLINAAALPQQNIVHEKTSEAHRAYKKFIMAG